MAPTQEPQPGDLIEVFRIAFQHWAVYVGDGYIIHVAPATDVPDASANTMSSASNKKAIVKKERLKDMVGNNRWEINNSLDKKYKPRSPAVIVKTADECVGMEIPYNLLMANCEHFVNILRYGEAESRQAEEGVGLLGLGVAAFGAMALALMLKR